MFTGIIEEIGKIKSFNRSTITVECKTVLENTKIGDSISINGCCQTVVNLNLNEFSANVSDETFKVTNFKTLKAGDTVNLERALTPSSRIGGHIVQGHIDNTAKFIKQEKIDNFYNLYFEIPTKLEQYVVKKGSVALNGISLTVAEINSNILKVAVIPHTFLNTNLKYLKINDIINIETDILSKYIEKLIQKTNNKIDENFLKENGFI